jgi:hypothetical protein
LINHIAIPSASNSAVPKPRESATIIDFKTRKPISEPEAIQRQARLPQPKPIGLFAALRRLALCAAIYFLSILVSKLNVRR